MKKTTYQIGKEGRNAPNEKFSTHRTLYTDTNPEAPEGGRRSDPNNPNKKLALGFGYGCEKGTEIH